MRSDEFIDFLKAIRISSSLSSDINLNLEDEKDEGYKLIYWNALSQNNFLLVPTK